MSFIDGITPADLIDFEAEGYSDEDAIDLAQGLLEDAVPCLSSLYTDLSPADKKVAKFAVLEMAKYIKIDYFNFERSTSPFSSEVIGSYSYHKMVRSVQSMQSTGVPAFDRAVGILGALCDQEGGIPGGAVATSEIVFAPGYEDFISRRENGSSATGWHWGVGSGRY